MRFTNSMKVKGELEVRALSKKALDFYNNTDPLEVYEYEGEDGEKLYAYKGCFGDSEGLTFEQLQADFESLADEINSDED